MRFVRLIIMCTIIAPLILSFNFFKTKTRNYEDMANEIMANVAKTLTKRHGMDWIGEGGGMMGSVYLIKLRFQIHHAMDREEARKRVIDCVQELLAAVNANEEIRPYLKNYPFTEKNVNIAIFTTYPDGSEVFDPYIKVVSANEQGKIFFRTDDLESSRKKCTFKSVYEESYSQAVEKLKSPEKPTFASSQTHMNVGACRQ